jgi:cellulose synthase/poly-beta-1,6-N-acetylglucosamine synthase-like glycosyltransferase
MIEGFIPLVCLWLIVTGTWTSLGLHLATPWRKSALGRHLTVYIGVLAVWWALILVGSYVGTPGTVGTLPPWLLAAQGVAFVTMAPAVWWRVVLQIRARRKGREPRHDEDTGHPGGLGSRDTGPGDERHPGAV